MVISNEAVQTICGFCHAYCGMTVYIKDGEIDRVRGNPDHPINNGRLCPKGGNAKEVVYSPHRIHYPLNKIVGGFNQVSWAEALTLVADKLSQITEK